MEMCVYKLMCVCIWLRRWKTLVRSTPGFFAEVGDWQEHWASFK